MGNLTQFRYEWDDDYDEMPARHSVEDDPEKQSQAEELYKLLSDEQKEIADAVGRKQNIFITGVAGTGKSFLIDYLRLRYDVDITATTGIAACNIGGSTIHSWAGIGICKQEIVDCVAKIKYQKFMRRVFENIIHCKRLIIDEISMFGTQPFEYLDQVLRLVRGVQNKPFGGIQVILTGDFLQLPPVSKEEDNNYFCFKSPVWSEANFKVFQLTKVFRQNNIRFVEALNRARMGELTQDDIQLFKSRETNQVTSLVLPVMLYPTNSEADTKNIQELCHVNGDPQEYSARDLFYAWDEQKEAMMPIDPDTMSAKQRQFLEEKLNKDCLAPKNLILKEGAQVMLLKNINFEAGLVNGSIGVVNSLMASSVIVEFNNGSIFTLEREIWEIYEGKNVVASRSQIPLRLAWGITMHKCQGMTLDSVYCDLTNIFERGQAYVALSRAKSLEGLYLRGFDVNKVVAHKEAVDFYKSISK